MGGDETYRQMASGRHDCLQSAKAEIMKLMREIEDIDSLCDDIQKANDKLDKENKLQESEIAQLELKCDELEKKAAASEKLTSSSRDARKMYGDMTPGDTTHQDVTLMYQNYFKHAFRNLPKDLGVPKEEKYRVWETTAQIVETCFERNKGDIIDTMISELEQVLIERPTSKPLDEKTHDLYRAFKIFVQEKQAELEGIKQEIQERLKSKKYDPDTAEKLTKLALDIITQLDPNDYYSFIERGGSHTGSGSPAAAIATKADGKATAKDQMKGLGDTRSGSPAAGVATRASDKATAKDQMKGLGDTRSGSPATGVATRADGKATAKDQMKDVARCFACEKAFEENETPEEYLGHTWHKHHYHCKKCSNYVGDNFLYVPDLNSTYCSRCLCGVCRQPLHSKVQQYLRIENKRTKVCEKCYNKHRTPGR